MEIKKEHLDWLDANIGNYENAKNGYIRNLELPDLQMYEHIYRTYLDPNFLLSVWCGNCKFEMIMRLYKWYEKQVFEIQDEGNTFYPEKVKITLNVQPKRKYTKRNG